MNYHDLVRESIKTHGWHGQHVFPSEDETGAPFNYTIGLTERDLPELIVFGLPPHIGHLVLRDLIKHIDKAGSEPLDHEVLDDVISGFNAVTRTLPPAAMDSHLCQAKYFFEGREVRAMQLVWPDPEGHFPWDIHCNPRMAALQSEIVDFTKEIRQ